MKTQKKIYIGIISVLLVAQLLPMTAFGQSALLPAASTVEQPTADPFTSASSSAEENAPADFFDESPLSSATASAPFQAGTCSFVSECEGTLVRQGSNLDVVISGTGTATKLELIDVNGLVFSLELPDIQSIVSGNFSEDGKKIVIQHESKKLTFLDLLDLQALTKEVPESFNGAQVSALNSSADVQGSEVEAVLTEGTSVRVLKDASGKVTQEITTYYYPAANVRRQINIQFNSASSVTVFSDVQYGANGAVVDGWKDEAVYASNGTTVIARTQTKIENKAVTKIYFSGTVKTHDVRTEYYTHGGAVSRIVTAHYNAQGSVTLFRDEHYSANGKLSRRWLDKTVYAADGKTKVSGTQILVYANGRRTVSSILYYANGNKQYDKTRIYSSAGKLTGVTETRFNGAERMVSFNELTYDAVGKVQTNFTETRSYYVDGTIRTSDKVQYQYGVLSYDLKYEYHANGKLAYFRERGWHANGKIYNQNVIRYNAAGQKVYQEKQFWDNRGVSTSRHVWRR